MKTKKILLGSSIFMMIVIFFGCTNNKLNKSAYNKLQIGMELSEVEKLMGFVKNETLVVIDETKTTNLGTFGKITHSNLQVDDKDKVSRFAYVPINNPGVLIVEYSYSTKNERKVIILNFDNKGNPSNKNHLKLIGKGSNCF
jgi:hypothetical protein